MVVSVTVYYKGGPERKAELSDTLARIHRRVDALPPGRKLTVAEERVGKVEDRIREMDTKEADDAMRSKFHQDMRALTKLCSTAMRGPVSVEYREPDATAPGSLVWMFRSTPPAALNTVIRLMEAAGLHAVDSQAFDAAASRYDFKLDDLDAAGCNRIRLATEEAAKALREEYDGKKTSDQVGGCVHADERQIPVSAVNRYGVVRAAARAVSGASCAGHGRGRASWKSGGLCVGSGMWLTPFAEATLWIRETMKWISREGDTDRDELEAQIGARVGNKPSKDASLFDQAVNAIVGSAHGRFDGKSLGPMNKKKRKKEEK